MKKIYIFLTGILITTIIVFLILINNISQLSNNVRTIELKQLLNEYNLDNSDKNKITLSPSDTKGFLKIETSSGFFFISLKNTEPYLDGVKVYLEIGNPINATYNGFIFKVKYGPHLDYTQISNNTDYYSKWNKSLKEKEISFSDKLMLGRWNRINFILTQIKPEEFGYLEIVMESVNVSLYYQETN